MSMDRRAVSGVPELSSLLISVDEEATRRNAEVVLRAFTGGCELQRLTSRHKELVHYTNRWRQECSDHTREDYWRRLVEYNDAMRERNEINVRLLTLRPCGACALCHPEQGAVKVKKIGDLQPHISVHKIEAEKQETCRFFHCLIEEWHGQVDLYPCGQCKTCLKLQEQQIQRWEDEGGTICR